MFADASKVACVYKLRGRQWRERGASGIQMRQRNQKETEQSKRVAAREL